jgi:hypothetical protein
LITVSNISRGAGSVAVAARPALPNTDSTSGKLVSILSWVCSSSPDLVSDIEGSEDGIYNSVPSFNTGMNSLPSCIAGNTDSPSATRAMTMVSFFQRITHAMTGR